MSEFGLICIAIALWYLGSQIDDAADTIADAIRETFEQPAIEGSEEPPAVLHTPTGGGE